MWLIENDWINFPYVISSTSSVIILTHFLRSSSSAVVALKCNVFGKLDTKLHRQGKIVLLTYQRPCSWLSGTVHQLQSGESQAGWWLLPCLSPGHLRPSYGSPFLDKTWNISVPSRLMFWNAHHQPLCIRHHTNVKTTLTYYPVLFHYFWVALLGLFLWYIIHLSVCIHMYIYVLLCELHEGTTWISVF